MSQKIISQRVQRTCEGCGKVQEWEFVEPSENTMREMQTWYTVIREVFVEAEGRWVKLLAQSCCLACVPAAATKLALPPQPTDPGPSEIDLAALRVSTDVASN